MNHQPSNNIKHLNKKKQKLYHSTAENIQKHRKFNGRKQLKLSRATDAFLHPFPFFHQRAIRQAPQHLRRQRRPFAHHKAALGAAHDAKNGPWLELKQVLDVLRRHRQMLSAENAEFLIKTVDIWWYLWIPKNHICGIPREIPEWWVAFCRETSTVLGWWGWFPGSTAEMMTSSKPWKFKG